MYESRDRTQQIRNRILTRREKENELSRKRVISALAEHREGRLFLAWLLEIGKSVGVNPFNGNALGTAFNCGEQNVGQRIMAQIIETDENIFVTVLKELSDDRRNTERELANAQRGVESSTDNGAGSELGEQRTSGPEDPYGEFRRGE